MRQQPALLDSPNDDLGWWTAIKVGTATAALTVLPLWVASHASVWWS